MSDGGNPASKRMSNPSLKARRQRSWNKAQVEKPRRNLENKARAARNAEIRDKGSLEHRIACAFRTDEHDPGAWLTPHELQTERRRRYRDVLRDVGELPPIGTTRAAWEKTKKITTTFKENA